MEHIIKEGVAFSLAKECREKFESIKHNLVGLFPKSAACGVIFYICRQERIPITKSKLSKCLEICTPTLSKSVKVIERILEKREREREKNQN